MKLQETSDLYTELLLCQTSQASATMCSSMLNEAVKGINLISAVIHTNTADLPVGFEIQAKELLTIEKDKHGNDKMKRKSRYSINQLARKLVKQTLKNIVNIDYVIGDRYFSSKENFNFFNKHKSKFVLGICSNRLVATSKSDAKAGNYCRIDELELGENEAIKVFLKDINSRQVFKNGDNSTGEIYLVINDLNLKSNHIQTIYQKRWNIETYHRSLKQNVSLPKSPTSVKKTQLNHIGLFISAFIELEKLKIASSKNQYAHIKIQILYFFINFV